MWVFTYNFNFSTFENVYNKMLRKKPIYIHSDIVQTHAIFFSDLIWEPNLSCLPKPSRCNHPARWLRVIPAFCMHIWVKMPPTPYRSQSLWLVIYGMREGVSLPGWGCKRLRLPAPIYLSTLSDDLFLGNMWITPLLLFSHSAMSNSSQPHYCNTPGFSVLHYLLEFAQTHVHCVDDTIQPSHPLSPPSLLPSNFPSIRVFSNELALRIRWPKHWSITFSISPSNEYSGLISFRIDWLVWSPCCPRDSQESFPAPQFESINSSVLSLLYGSALTSVRDYLKNHSFV